MTTLIRCNNKCPEHTFQDKTYGKGIRVANLKAKEDQATCTVCKSLVNKNQFIKSN